MPPVRSPAESVTLASMIARVLRPYRLLRRHRHAAALLGVTILSGVAALNVHAAVPHEHDRVGHSDDQTICIAAHSSSVLASAPWRHREPTGPKQAHFPPDCKPPARARCAARWRPAREKPDAPLVLRC